MLRQMILLILFSFSTGEYLSAQQTGEQGDSTNLYTNINSYSRRSKFTKFFYRLIFRPVASDLPKKKKPKQKQKKTIQKP